MSRNHNNCFTDYGNLHSACNAEQCRCHEQKPFNYCHDGQHHAHHARSQSYRSPGNPVYKFKLDPLRAANRNTRSDYYTTI